MQEQQIVDLQQQNGVLTGQLKTLVEDKDNLVKVTTELQGQNAKLNSITTELQEMKDQLASLRSNQGHSNHPPLNSSENET